METMDYIAVIASILTILSVCLNIIQRIQRVEMIKALRARSQAGYNYFFQIARRADTIRALVKSDKSAEEKVDIAIRTGHWLTGCADAARNDIISYSREHLDFIPVEEHPAKPITTTLPSPKTKKQVEAVNKQK